MDRFTRIMAAIDRQPLDRFPTDIWLTDEVMAMLKDYAGTRDWLQVLDYLDIDGIIGVGPRYIGPKLPDLGPDLQQNEWGIINKRQRYDTGEYWEQVFYPLAKAETIADLDAYAWPRPEWYDFSVIPDHCRAAGGRAVELGYTAMFYYHNLLRGLELSMMDIVLRPEFTAHFLQRLADTFYAFHEASFEAAQGQAHTTQVTDDFGSQKGLLISKGLFRDFYRPWMERAIAQAKRFGLRVMHHDDGAMQTLIPDLIEMGVDLLNPIQWRCQGMDRAMIGREYGARLSFHGGVDNQQTLPFGTPDDVRAEVAYNIQTLGASGTGYIIAPCHCIQANTPIENILALYQAKRV